MQGLNPYPLAVKNLGLYISSRQSLCSLLLPRHLLTHLQEHENVGTFKTLTL